MIPKFYFINMNKSEDRHNHMKKFFKKLGKRLDEKIRFQRVEALDAVSANHSTDR